MSTWAQAIGFIADNEGAPSVEMIIGHIRAAVLEAGFVSRGRITLGLKEAYRPLALDETLFTTRIDEALRLLRLSGDLDEYATAAGRGYAPTPPRRVDWGGAEVATLGAAVVSGASIAVRRIARDIVSEDTIANVSLHAELGRPEWRNVLVELGGADAPGEGPAALFRLIHGLAGSGERYALEEPNMVAVLSGRGSFFGKAIPRPLGVGNASEMMAASPPSSRVVTVAGPQCSILPRGTRRFGFLQTGTFGVGLLSARPWSRAILYCVTIQGLARSTF